MGLRALDFGMIFSCGGGGGFFKEVVHISLCNPYDSLQGTFHTFLSARLLTQRDCQTCGPSNDVKRHPWFRAFQGSFKGFQGFEGLSDPQVCVCV